MIISDSATHFMFEVRVWRPVTPCRCYEYNVVLIGFFSYDFVEDLEHCKHLKRSSRCSLMLIHHNVNSMSVLVFI